jgi:hypothetical protein
VERDRAISNPRLYLSSPLSSCPLHPLSTVCLLLSYLKFFRTRLVMEFSLAFFR